MSLPLLGGIAGIFIGAVMADVGGALLLGLVGLAVGFVIREQANRLKALDVRLSRLEAAGRTAASEPRQEAKERPEAASPTAVFPPASVRPAPTPAERVARAPETTTQIPLVGASTPQVSPVAPRAARPTAPPPRAPAPPARPSPILAWLTGGNTIVRVGLVILFVGLAFLIKYAADRRVLPDEVKVALVGLSGVALLVLGWRLRDTRRGYALSLQGAGVAVLYLTILASMRLYALLPSGVAFALLAAIAAASAVLAVRQDALALAVIASAGGFLAPILVSTGAGNHVALFSYYLVLNVGIALIAWYKAWRVLNVVGFAFTFVIGALWGWRSYQPQHFATTEPFLVTFFLLYVGIAVLFARRQAPALRSYVDGTLVFGTPLAAFALQAGLTRNMEFGLAYSSLAAAAIYVTLASALNRVGRESYRLLTEAFLAVGVVFVSLAIPLALDARWTSAAWALEGAAIYWVGVRQRTPLTRAFALVLQLLAGGAFVKAYPDLDGDIPLLGAAFIGAVLLAVAGLWTNRLMGRARADGAGTLGEYEAQFTPVLFGWGLAWLLFAGLNEIGEFVHYTRQPMALVAFLTAATAAFAWLHRRLDWPEARWPLMGLLPALALLALISAVAQSHPFAHYGWLAWPFAFIAHTVMLRRIGPPKPTPWFGVLHIGAYVLFAILGAWEANWAAAQVTAHETTWSVAAVLLVPAALVFWTTSAQWDDRWPLSAESFGAWYRGGGAPILVGLMAFWTLYANATHDGTSDPLPYLPLLNAIDLGHMLVALSAGALWISSRRTGVPSPEAVGGIPARIVASALTFIWLNAILLRSIHHWADVPYNGDAMMESVLVQSALSVFWTFLALAVMVFATRRALRTPWMVGAGLMAVVVAKLVLVDLSRVSGVERIVSFIGVGVLMLVVGYFSPVPPRAESGMETAS